jgi:BNR/Asp-box repeat
MGDYLFLATRAGVAAYERAGDDWRETMRGLTGHNVTGIIAREGVILAGTTDGIFRSDDLGETWHEASTGLSIGHTRWMAYHPDISDLEFAGTEPADIFVSHDGGENWRGCPEVADLRDAHGWSLPYSPEAGCVREFAFSGQRAYAAVEVGGVLRSDDGGETWRLAQGSTGSPDLDSPPAPFIYPDVHSIVVHPSSPDLVFAPTGGGFYRSTDGGATWELLYDCYVRAVWADPDNPAHLILGPADGVDRNGRIEETHDGGRSWESGSTGLTAPWPRHMVERFHQVGDDLYAVLSSGDLIVTPIGEVGWREPLPAIKGVNALTAMG